MVDGRRSLDAVDERDRTCLMICAEYPSKFSIPMARTLIKFGSDPKDPGDEVGNKTILKMQLIYIFEYLICSETQFL